MLVDQAQARLEAEVLLAHVLGKPRSHLYTWPAAVLEGEQQERFEQLVQRRAAGEPVAYLTGQREFWSLELRVSPATLIPRPETELLVEQALALLPAEADVRVADLGTGSGAVAIALARERPCWQIVASDRSHAALDVAHNNARRLAGRNLLLMCGDWTGALAGQSMHAIVCNPPYVAETDPHLTRGDVRFEPRTALAAGIDGLDDLRRLSNDAMRVLRRAGWICLEHAPDQAARLRDLLAARGFENIATLTDLAGLERVTRARKPERGA
jgi:release factor glutamine methyltransferase